MDAHEIEEKIMELVKDQHKRTGGANGLNLFNVDKQLGVEYSEIQKAVEKLLSEKKIIYLNHLNGRSLTLPK